MEYMIYHGGAYEYVASYDKNGYPPYISDFGFSFASVGGTSNEYSMAYIGNNPNGQYIRGDATVETGGWNGDLNHFITNINTYFARGGSYNASTNAGIFSNGGFVRSSSRGIFFSNLSSNKIKNVFTTYSYIDIIHSRL